MKLSIIETSDVHGHISVESFREKGKKEAFSLSRAKTYIEKLRHKAQGPLIYIDNGDSIQGSPLANFYAKNQNPAPLMAAYKDLGLDAWVLGNHDFNYGRDYLKKAISYLEGRVLSANIKDERGDLGIRPYLVKDYPGLRLGILGLTTQYIPHWEQEDHIQGLAFTSALEAAKKYVPILREEEGCDLVILSYHGGFERDLEGGQALEKLTGENEGYQLLKSGLDFDVLLTGHQHGLHSGVYDGKALLQPGYRAEHLGQVDLDFDPKTKKIRVLQVGLVDLASSFPDPDLEEAFGPPMDQVQVLLDQESGLIDPPARIDSVIGAQVHGHPYIDLINQIQMDLTGAEVAATAIYKKDAPGLDRQVTLRAIMDNYPHNNTLTRIKIKGRDLKALLESNANYFILDGEGDLQVNPDYLYPKNTIFNYDIYSGIDYTYDYSQPKGSRLQEVLYRGHPLQDEEDLVFATNSYRAKGGGDVPVLDGSQITYESSRELPEMIYDYIKERKKVTIKDYPGLHIRGYRKIKEE
ncbi:MAG: bifunctional metallophosphatase/5'-nucleotidase [Tissierellia bacterium]|nr:bifunctional metallophosphatase/5'-nucleotidase [Tissierellia bacterium]